MQCPKCGSRLRDEAGLSLGSALSEDHTTHIPIRGRSCIICGYWEDTNEFNVMPIAPARGAGRRTADGQSVMMHVAKQLNKIAVLKRQNKSWRQVKTELRLPGNPATINKACTRLMARVAAI